MAAEDRDTEGPIRDATWSRSRVSLRSQVLPIHGSAHSSLPASRLGRMQLPHTARRRGSGGSSIRATTSSRSPCCGPIRPAPLGQPCTGPEISWRGTSPFASGYPSPIRCGRWWIWLRCYHRMRSKTPSMPVWPGRLSSPWRLSRRRWTDWPGAAGVGRESSGRCWRNGRWEMPCPTPSSSAGWGNSFGVRGAGGGVPLRRQDAGRAISCRGGLRLSGDQAGDRGGRVRGARNAAGDGQGLRPAERARTLRVVRAAVHVAAGRPAAGHGGPSNRCRHRWPPGGMRTFSRSRRARGLGGRLRRASPRSACR